MRKIYVSCLLDNELEEAFSTDLYDVLFHYNYHRKSWFCFDNSEKAGYFNGTTDKAGSGNSVTNALLDYLNKTKQDKEYINLIDDELLKKDL